MTASKSLTLHIKNMVCDRCVRVVREELETLQAEVLSVQLGEAVIRPSGGRPSLEAIRERLRASGFDLIDDRRARLVEKIKKAVIARIHHDNGAVPAGKFSSYLEKEIGADYHYMSTLFSSVENVTIERYVIGQKIERVKELLKYNELTLSEIADRLGYSSVAHLSAQFKKVTGMSASAYKRLRDQARTPIDRL